MSDLRRDELLRALPYARRYARALTGSQSGGDRLVADSLREMLADGAADAEPAELRRTFYAQVTRRFNRTEDQQAAPHELNAAQRQLLLLTSLEELRVEDAAPILSMTPQQAEWHLLTARERLRDAAATEVLIIEDEPIIAMDIEELVQNCGHHVVGVAATEEEAVAIAARTRPGLILADINLGAGGDGTAAVARILEHHRVPVIFVTAYPERLLTGEAPEPAFVITKPFEPVTLAIATYQAVTGGLRIG
jgi:CheY-like chemotaxis protein